MPIYLDDDNVAEFAECDIAEYALPWNPDVIVRIKSVPMSRIEQFQDANKQGGKVAEHAQNALIADSLVKADGKPFSTASLNKLLTGKARLVVALVKMISEHNGGDDQLKRLETDAGKKSEPTE